MLSFSAFSAEEKKSEDLSKKNTDKKDKSLEQKQIEMIRSVATKLYSDKSLSNN